MASLEQIEFQSLRNDVILILSSLILTRASVCHYCYLHKQSRGGGELTKSRTTNKVTYSQTVVELVNIKSKY